MGDSNCSIDVLSGTDTLGSPSAIRAGRSNNGGIGQDTLFALGAAMLAIVFVLAVPREALLYRGDMPYFHAVEWAIRQALGSGQLPLWNIYFSEPLFANPQAMVLYPTHLLLRWVDIPIVFMIDIAFHIWLTTLAIYLMLRDWALPRTACICAALSTAFSTMVVVRAVVGHIALLPILPWSLLTVMFYRRYLLDGERRHFYLTVATTVLVVLSGHTQCSLTGLMIPGSFFVYTLLHERGGRPVATVFARTAKVGLVSFGLLSIQLFPTLEYFLQTTRTDGFSLEEASFFALDPVSLLNTVSPILPMEYGDRVSVYQETAMYSSLMGVAWMVLAVRSSVPTYRRNARYLCILAGIAIVVSMGTSTPVYGLVYRLLPFIRAPGRFLLLWCYCVAMLTGIGFDTLTRDTSGRAVSLMSFLVVLSLEVTVLCVVLLMGRTTGQDVLRSTVYVSLTPVLLWALVLVLRRVVVPRTTWLGLVALGAIVDALCVSTYITVWPTLKLACGSVIGEYESGSRFQCFSERLRASDIRTAQLKSENDVRIPASYGIPGIQQYSANLAGVGDLIGLGAKGQHILAAGHWFTKTPASDDWELVEQACGLSLMLHKGTSPRVYVAQSLRVVSNDRSVSLAQVASDDFEPEETSVVSLPSENWAGALSMGTSPVEYQTEIREYSANRITVAVEVSREALMVVAEPYYPGWKATVDGNDAAIYRTNHALRGIVVPKGWHLVQLRYDPSSLKLGLAVTVLTVVSLMAESMIHAGGILRSRRRD